MRTRKDEILEYIFAPIGILTLVGGLLFVGTMATRVSHQFLLKLTKQSLNKHNL